jgi:hypothetical protein
MKRISKGFMHNDVSPNGAGLRFHKGYANGRPIIFLHIPKTAGTSITAFLRRNFPESEAMPRLQANFHRSHPLWPLVGRRYRLLGVGMHLDHDRVEALRRGQLDVQPYLLTVLREPRDRLLSLYKEWRSTPNTHFAGAAACVKDAIWSAKKRTFADFLRSDNPVVESALNNLQARLLAGLSASRNLSDEDVLDMARANLARYDLIGKSDTVEDTLRKLAEAYDWPVQTGPLPRLHVSPTAPLESLVTTAEDEERISSLTVLDRVLWDELHQGCFTGNGRVPEPGALSHPLVVLTARGCNGAGPAVRLQGLNSTRPPIRRDQRGASPETIGPTAPGLRTLRKIKVAYRPDRIVGLGRKKWGRELGGATREDITPRRVLFIVGYAALSHQRSRLIREAGKSVDSFLAVTEVDQEDYRLHAISQGTGLAACATMEGSGQDTVLVVAIGSLVRDFGADVLDLYVEALERCRETRPSAVKALEPSQPATELATVELLLSLVALDAVLSRSSTEKDRLLKKLATLYPERDEFGRSPFHDQARQLVLICVRLGTTLKSPAAALDDGLALRMKSLIDRVQSWSMAQSTLSAVECPGLAEMYSEVFDCLCKVSKQN